MRGAGTSKYRLKRGFQLSKNLSIFLICSAFAFVFWVLKLLSGQYTTIVEFPVRYINFPLDKVVLNHQPKSIAVKVDASGYDLIANSLGAEEDSITINGKYLLERKTGEDRYSYIATKPLLRKVTANIHSDMVISQLLLDTLRFYFDQKMTKVVPLDLNLRHSFKKQHVLKGEISYLPKAIKITGPQSIVDTMTVLRTQELVYLDLDKDLTSVISVKLDDNRITMSPENVLLTIPVEKFTEGEIELPIVLKNMPDNFTVKTFPNRIKIKYLVGLSNYNNIDGRLFEAVVDLKDMDQTRSTLKVDLVKYPDYVNVVEQTPLSVEYIVKKKE